MSEWLSRYGFADVRERLSIGAYPIDADDVRLLAGLGVDRVLNLTQDGEYPPGARAAVALELSGAGITERRVPFEDFGRLDARSLQLAVEQTLAWLAGGHTVYVHCRAGRHRSVAVAAGVLALAEGVSLDDALAAVRRRRPGAAPLPHQLDDLRAWWTDGPGARRPPGPSGGGTRKGGRCG
ncbi:MAG TPA: dual specificity protein phosphatase family protein [Solirubrobacteraceae bacterium]|nr:dual specificity protein phosphatase family protein [Solirubrobacteraceae bacterium]